MKSLQPSDYVEPYLDDAIRGERRPAIRLTLDLLDNGVPEDRVVTDLLAAAQCEVGERWYRNEFTVVDEHVVTGVSAAALAALAGESTPPASTGHTVVSCAEGDWHSLAAQMFGETLRSHGVGVTVLGASTPADLVAKSLSHRGADSLAVSCSVPIFFAGVARLVNAAHREGFPVIVGGRAMGGDSRRAERLGADAWASTAAEAAVILDHWRSHPPAISHNPTPLHPVAVRLAADAWALGHSALDGLAARFPPLADYDERQRARTSEDLVFIVQFLAAAILVADDVVFTEFLVWLQILLINRSVPRRALITGLEELRPAIAAVDASAARLLDTGRQQLVNALG